MTAKEMFEKLDYKNNNNEDAIVWYKTEDYIIDKYSTYVSKEFCINKNNKDLYIYYKVGVDNKPLESDYIALLEFDEILAISKQIEELGW